MRLPADSPAAEDGPITWRLGRWLVAATVLVVVLCWVLVLRQQGEMRAALEQADRRELDNLALAFEEVVSRVLQASDLGLLKAQQKLASGEAPQAVVDALVQDSGLGAVVLSGAHLVDERGIEVADRHLQPTPHGADENFGGSDWFRAHLVRGGPALFVSEPQFLAHTQRWHFMLSRRIEHADGRLRGVLAIGINLAYLGHVFARLDLGPGGAAGLLNANGTTLVRAGTDGSLRYGFRQPDDTLLERIRAGERVAQWAARSVLDGSQRLYAIRRVLPEPGLIIVVARDIDTVEAARDQADRLVWGVLLLATLLVAAATGGALYSLDRREGYEARLRASEAEARAADRAKGAFLAAVSHELRTPLTGILGYAELIVIRGRDEKMRPLAETIRASAVRLNKLLNEVLDAAKVEAGAMTVSLAPEAIRELVRDVCVLFEAAARAKGLALEWSVHADVPERIDCDAMRTRQVISNLLSNALKFTEEGSVAVNVTCQRDRVLIAVSDTGPGVPDAARETIFERFRQADDRVAYHHGGTGLGLSLSRDFARLMGGRLSLVPPEPGTRGATFVLELPLRPDTPTTEPGATAGTVAIAGPATGRSTA